MGGICDPRSAMGKWSAREIGDRNGAIASPRVSHPSLYGHCGVQGEPSRCDPILITILMRNKQLQLLQILDKLIESRPKKSEKKMAVTHFWKKLWLLLFSVLLLAYKAMLNFDFP